jgi:DNA-binding transcriptional MerR regulator/mannose-6-phosphate isomerase-like protein (cupin superfamily)
MVPFVCPQAAPPHSNPTNANRHTRTHIFELIAAPLGKAGATPTPETPHPLFWLQLSKKPYYNSGTLEEGPSVVKGKLNLRPSQNRTAKDASAQGYFRISDVARIVGVSPSILRSWENLGLVAPTRTRSQYRIYTHADVRILKRAQFFRRARGMNAPAIVHLLKTHKLLPHANQRPKAGPVGPRLRRLRLQRKASLSQVARATGVSVGFLSAVERNQMTASVATLRRLARFYRVNILSLFNPSEANPGRVKPADRKVLEAGPGVRMELLSWGNTAMMEPHLFRIAPSAGSGESYAHDGEEFLFVLRGALEIVLDGGEKHTLEEGDSFYFESSNEHHWKNPGKKETLVLWINTPPTF